MTYLIVVIGLCLLAAIAVSAAETHIDNRELLRVVQENKRAIELIDERMREGNLRILKCLKGESYQGSFGGMDVHTDPSIPPDGGFIFDRKAFE